jgi:hypothetical protein
MIIVSVVFSAISFKTRRTFLYCSTWHVASPSEPLLATLAVSKYSRFYLSTYNFFIMHLDIDYVDIYYKDNVRRKWREKADGHHASAHLYMTYVCVVASRTYRSTSCDYPRRTSKATTAGRSHMRQRASMAPVSHGPHDACACAW